MTKRSASIRRIACKARLSAATSPVCASLSPGARRWTTRGTTNIYGRTALWVAARNGHEAPARALLETGPGKDKAENDGETPLWAASRYGHEAVARALLVAGADKDKASNDGETPLLAAARYGHEALARALQEVGAKIKIHFCRSARGH